MSLSFNDCFPINNNQYGSEVKRKESENYSNDDDQENLNVRMNQVSIHCIPRSLSDTNNESLSKSDHALLQAALRNYSTFDLTVAQDEFAKFLLSRLSFMRQHKKKVECRGLKGTNIKKIKYAFELHPGNQQIKKLHIGKYFTKGGFTKVYLTLDDKAILIPRKDIPKAKSACDQMTHARSNCLAMHIKYKKEKEHSEKTKNLLTSLNLFQDNFEKEKQLILKMLPPLPEIIIADGRPISILPRATPASEIFDTAPKNANEILQRLRIIADVATTLALLHEKNFVHGDIKPDNLLVNSEGVGQLHDFGGSNFFDDPDDPKRAAGKYSSLSITPQYTHYFDRNRYETFANINGSEADFLQLGQARDVFSLAVSTIRAMIGMRDSSGTKHPPYNLNAYVTRDYGSHTRTFIEGAANRRTPITCIKKFFSEVDAEFEALLESALNPVYLLRPTASELAVVLHQICEKIKTTLPSTRG